MAHHSTWDELQPAVDGSQTFASFLNFTREIPCVDLCYVKQVERDWPSPIAWSVVYNKQPADLTYQQHRDLDCRCEAWEVAKHKLTFLWLCGHLCTRPSSTISKFHAMETTLLSCQCIISTWSKAIWSSWFLLCGCHRFHGKLPSLVPSDCTCCFVPKLMHVVQESLRCEKVVKMNFVSALSCNACPL